MAAVDLRVEGGQGDSKPLTLVAMATEAHSRAIDEEAEIDEFWCVFDVEWPQNHPGLKKAAAGPGHARDASPEEKDAWRQATLRRTVVASAFGLPSCVIPGAVRPPEGLALTGPPGADHALLDAALAVAGSGAART